MSGSHPDPVAAFAARLRRLRTERGISQEELAHRAGLDRTYVSSCEAGRRNVTIRTISRLSEALSVDAAALVSDRESSETSVDS
jgi:transcriptional regulator with XRE-family HTH domain